MASIRDYVRRSGVTVAYAPYGTGDAPGTFAEIGHITGDVSISDSRNMVTVREFSTDRKSFDLQYGDGRTGSVSLTLNLVPSDAGFQALKDDYENGDEGFLYIRGFDEKGTPTGVEYRLNVMVQTFPVTFRQDGVASVQVTFAITGTGTFTAPTLP